MVALYSDFQKMHYARAIAKETNCFIVEQWEKGLKVYLLYRRGEFKNYFIGKRRSVTGILSLTKKQQTE